MKAIGAGSHQPLILSRQLAGGAVLEGARTASEGQKGLQGKIPSGWDGAWLVARWIYLCLLLPGLRRHAEHERDCAQRWRVGGGLAEQRD